VGARVQRGYCTGRAQTAKSSGQDGEYRCEGERQVAEQFSPRPLPQRRKAIQYPAKLAATLQTPMAHRPCDCKRRRGGAVPTTPSAAPTVQFFAARNGTLSNQTSSLRCSCLLPVRREQRLRIERILLQTKDLSRHLLFASPRNCTDGIRPASPAMSQLVRGHRRAQRAADRKMT
jgi:hypothetical protein